MQHNNGDIHVLGLLALCLKLTTQKISGILVIYNNKVKKELFIVWRLLYFPRHLPNTYTNQTQVTFILCKCKTKFDILTETCPNTTRINDLELKILGLQKTIKDTKTEEHHRKYDNILSDCISEVYRQVFDLVKQDYPKVLVDSCKNTTHSNTYLHIHIPIHQITLLSL
jgi:hypothetical protein